MRTRILALAATIAVALSVVTAFPALAAYDVTVGFPDGDTEFYSPFDGPATITFSFAPDDSPTLFRVRLRPVGGSSIKTSYVSINPDTQVSPVVKSFGWGPLNVGSQKPYEVIVNPDGQGTIAQAAFVLRPKLVMVESANPNPFLPWVSDGVKDTTTIRFNLSNDTQATEARVFKANLQGKCCGDRKRTDGLGSTSAGPHPWVWDGRDDLNDLLPKGDYFVRIWGEDANGVSGLSNAFKVSIARTYRDTTTIQKPGIKYHHSGPVTSYRRGGNCFVTKDETDQDLWITCLSASFTVYWRWNLPNGSRLEQAKFVFVQVSGNICGAKKGHTRTDTYLKVGGVGQFRCRIDTAKALYSFPVQS
jgi:hypothetical protein